MQYVNQTVILGTIHQNITGDVEAFYFCQWNLPPPPSEDSQNLGTTPPFLKQYSLLGQLKNNVALCTSQGI